MGWQDAPVVPRETSVGAGGGWQSAPVVSGAGTRESRIAAIPGNEVAPTPDKPTGIVDKVRGGAEAGLSMLSAIPAGIAGNVAGVGRSLTGGHFGTPAGVRQGAQAAQDVSSAMTYQPRTQAGQGMLQGMAGAFDASKLGGLNPSTAMSGATIPRPPMAVAGQAAREGAGQAGQYLRPAFSAAGKAIAESPEGDLMRRGAAKVGQIAKPPPVDPQLAELAQKAEAMGIKVTPDMLSDNKFLRMMGEASRQVPLAGSPTAGNREAFNRAIIKSFGGDEKATKISTKVYAQAMDKHGSEIGRLSEKYPVPAEKLQLNDYLQSIARETPDVQGIAAGYVADIMNAGKDGVIDGTALRKLRTKLTGQMRRTNNGDLKHTLSELDDRMLDAIQGQLSTEEQQAFNQARLYYSNGKRVEPLIAKAAAKGSGDMSPAALANRLTATGGDKTAVAKGKGGELADIAAAGSRFMTEPGSSNTAERSAAYGMLGGSGLIGGPMAAGTLWSLANLYNRFGPAVARRMMQGGGIPPPP